MESIFAKASNLIHDGNGSSSKARPRRFPIQTHFRYRESGATLWRQGITIDISRSGVLFHAEFTLPLRTLLEMRIGIPSEMTGGAAAVIICCGPVVRSQAASAESGKAACVAAFFRNYRFSHQ